MISNIEKVNSIFHLPISYNSERIELQKNIVNDLELVETVDPSGVPLFHCAFQPKTCFGKKVLHKYSNFYTTDTKFLKDTQQLLKQYQLLVSTVVPSDYDDIISIWNEIKNDTGFREKYQYIDWDYWEHLNKSDTFLQFMSVYNLASPVLSFLVPVIIVIVPFLIIKMKGLEITLNEYTEILKTLASQHAIGKLFTQFHEVKLDEKIYLILSAAFYVFSIYQNMLTCLRFHQNMIKIHKHLLDLEAYIVHTEKTMNNFLLYSNQLKSYDLFNAELKRQLSVLFEFKSKLQKIHPYEFNMTKLGEFGIVLKSFYDIYSDPIYNESFLYSFGFHGYIDTIEGLQSHIIEKNVHFIKFSKKTGKSKFVNMYYPNLVGKQPIKNSYSFNKNMTITGPNASGKTTILKSTLINVILSQQVGCGFYDKTSTLCPFKYIHCYLNIPDTSGRDSLFQAEARRCKEILDVIEENKEENHFCGFDELYSGTNPDEAIMSAYAFMKYLLKYKRVNYILTTHFIQLCEKLDSNEKMVNCHMNTKAFGDSFQYTYELKKGISTVRGGFKVLEDMNYPKEIIDNTNEY
jgi:hypothetical protein